MKDENPMVYKVRTPILLFVVVMIFPLLFLQAGEKSASENQAKPGISEEQKVALYMKGKRLALDGQYAEAAELLEKTLSTEPENPFLNFQLSDIYVKQSDFLRAESLGKKAVEKAPDDLEYRTNLAQIYLSLKKYDEAREQFQYILDHDRSNRRALLMLGSLEADTGNPEKGIKMLTQAIKENNENHMAYFYRARIYLLQNALEKGKEDLSMCLALKPNFIEAGQALGLLYEQLGDMDKAIETYHRIQGNGAFRKRLAQIYLEKNEYAKALSELLEYEKIEPEDYTARVKVASIYYELKDYAEAQKRLVKILEEQPEADRVHYYLALVLKELKDVDGAIKEFNLIPKDSQLYKESMLQIGFLYRELERIKEGLKFSGVLLKKNPGVVEFYDLHASFYEHNKNYRKALEVISSGLKIFSDHETLLYYEGAIHDKLGNRDKAIENMKKIVAKNSSHAHALNFLGYTYAEMGTNLDEAEKYIKEALKLRPNDGYIMDSLGWVYYKRGKLKEALKELHKAAEIQPEEVVIFEHLGDVYLEMKDFDRAAENYKNAVALSEKKKDKEMVDKIKGKLASLDDKRRVPSSGHGK